VETLGKSIMHLRTYIHSNISKKTYSKATFA